MIKYVVKNKLFKTKIKRINLIKKKSNLKFSDFLDKHISKTI